MSILDWFAKKKEQAETAQTKRLDIPGDLWVKCFDCGGTLYLKDLVQNQKVCHHCNYHFRIASEERIGYIFDEKSFEPLDEELTPIDFLEFEDTEKYKDRIRKAHQKTKKNEAITIGTAALCGMPVNVGGMDFAYLGGSMGSVVGEKITRLIEYACDNGRPVIIFTASGGARMQEGILSLMQMAKTSAALEKLARKRVPYISVLCDPTTGGTSASFAMLGDMNIAEPNALISFAGPRVIEQTIRQKLPKGFQRSEFLLKHGMLDKVVNRKEMRQVLSQLIALLTPEKMDETMDLPVKKKSASKSGTAKEKVKKGE